MSTTIDTYELRAELRVGAAAIRSVRHNVTNRDGVRPVVGQVRQRATGHAAGRWEATLHNEHTPPQFRSDGNCGIFENAEQAFAAVVEAHRDGYETFRRRCTDPVYPRPGDHLPGYRPFLPTPPPPTT